MDDFNLKRLTTTINPLSTMVADMKNVISELIVENKILRLETE